MTDQALQTALVKLNEKAVAGGHPDGLRDLIAQGEAMLAGRPTLMTRDGMEARLIELLGCPIDQQDVF